MRGRAAGGQVSTRPKVVVMNAPGAPYGGQYPTLPVDDFSVALWTFAELALEKVGLEVVEIAYHDGQPLYVQERRTARPRETVAMLLFYKDAHKYRAARARRAWISSTFGMQVMANGDVMDGPFVRSTLGTRRLEWLKLGNILTWKFSPRWTRWAFDPPEPRQGQRRRA